MNSVFEMCKMNRSNLELKKIDHLTISNFYKLLVREERNQIGNSSSNNHGYRLENMALRKAHKVG